MSAAQCIGGGKAARGDGRHGLQRHGRTVAGAAGVQGGLRDGRGEAEDEWRRLVCGEQPAATSSGGGGGRLGMSGGRAAAAISVPDEVERLTEAGGGARCRREQVVWQSAREHACVLAGNKK